MSAEAAPDNTISSRPPRVKEFFLARQPILDRAQDLVGYELLFRRADTIDAGITSDLSATASVIEHASQLGMEKVVGASLGYLNVDAKVLESDIFQFLPREKVVLEIVESMKVTPEILDRVAELVRAGFRFALDDVIAETEEVRQLMPLIDVVKLDLRGMPLSALLTLTPRFKRENKKLLAEKVETREQFQTCLELGFDYFQGYYFAKPVILQGRKLSPSQSAILRLLSLTGSDVDNAIIEDAIKEDVSLCLNLLRLVNTPAIGAKHRIDSIGQALLVLGRMQLQRWLQIMLYAEPCRKGESIMPLLSLATARGKLLELIAQKTRPDKRAMADTAFTVGIMSLMDTLFSMPMEDVLEQMSVVDEVSDALLRRTGAYGDMLRLVECTEQADRAGTDMASLLDRLGLSGDELCSLQLAAFEWSGMVARSAH